MLPSEVGSAPQRSKRPPISGRGPLDRRGFFKRCLGTLQRKRNFSLEPVSRVLSGRSQDDGGLRLGQVRGELFQRLTAIYTDAGPHEPVAGRVGDTWLGSGGTFEPGFLNHPRHSVAELAGRVAEVDHGMAYERFELGLTVEHLVVKIGGR